MEKGVKRTKFLILALLLTLYSIGLHFLDRTLMLKGYLTCVINFVIVLFLTLFLKSKNERFIVKFNAKYMFFVVITFVFSVLLFASKTNALTSRADFIKNLIFLIVSILLEELFFRSFAVFYFDEDCVVSLSNGLFIIAILAVCKLPLLFFSSFLPAILEIILSVSFSVFVFGLYLSSKSVLLCFITTLFKFATMLYFSSFSIGLTYVNGVWFYLLFVFEMLFYIAVGSIFIMRNTIRK